ncbi:hypothetical protein SAMN04488550_4154 [Gordonia malaquae]|uniref:hypothetical protein n=2 Tax=Gordonia malaquae TaxID=410332 RepID=UPI0008998774|nr:hypothetical protein [Gordonia malaquae]SEE25497.1 hypothetical protein SAMN04488550_4154 [Gordonia malaquae]
MSTDGYLTRVEQDALKTLLDAIHNWIAEALDDTLTRQNRFTIGPRSGPQKRRETPLPFHAQASDAAADLNGTLKRPGFRSESQQGESEYAQEVQSRAA